MARMDADELSALAASVGLSGEAQRIAVAIAIAESGGDPAAKNVNGNGSTDQGLWQINSVHNLPNLYDPAANARAMMKVSGGGRNWSPWVVYKTGKYKLYMNKAGSLSPRTGPIADAADAANSVVESGLDIGGGALASLGNIANVLGNPAWWRRIGVGAAGVVLVVLGGLWVVKDVTPAGAIIKAATTAKIG